jgi:hypothetical protein
MSAALRIWNENQCKITSSEEMFVETLVRHFLLLSLAPQPSLGLGLLHKIQLNFLEASQQFSFLQGRVVKPHAQPPSRRTRPLYLYHPEAGWLPILVAPYDMHGLRWDYSYSPVTTRNGSPYILENTVPSTLKFLPEIEREPQKLGYSVTQVA